jgi:hypothetical protein
MNIKDFVNLFKSRLDTVPIYHPDDEEEDAPQEERGRFHANTLRQAERELKDVKERASRKDAANLKMQDLYLGYTGIGPDITAPVNQISRKFQRVQRTLKWICMPFLQFTGTGAITRPTTTELNRHLTGDEQILFGVESYTYRGFILLPTSADGEPDKYKRTRQFAFDKGFFDRDNVVVSYKKRMHIPLAGGALATEDYIPFGGGNGYKCHINAEGQKSCIPGAARDYCANGGQTCTG